MYKVIFDTNFLLEKRMKNFLGRQEELIKFSKIADIIIPDMVIGELKSKYKRIFTQEKKKYLEMSLSNILNNNLSEINIDDYINSMENNEIIEYKVIELIDQSSILLQIKELALKKKPPFEPKDSTDKGFKDTYIYFTVLEYLQNVSDKKIFFCTDDKNLTKAFDKHYNIKVIKTYDDFIKETIGQYQNDYFLEKINDNLSVLLRLDAISKDIKKENIIDFWSNINENDVVLVEVDGKQYVIEVDSNEIVNKSFVSLYKVFIDNFINSESFGGTHHSISDLIQYTKFLSDSEIINILNAVIDNGQIRQIITDEDVKQFVNDLYEAKKEILDEILRKKIAKILLHYDYVGF